VFLTVALDVVISGIHEPVRFSIEAKARVCESNKSGDIISQDLSDTIWSSFKKVTPSKSSPQDDAYEVLVLESKSESERRSKFRQLSSGK
jgi:hypothetical protein